MPIANYIESLRRPDPRLWPSDPLKNIIDTPHPEPITEAHAQAYKIFV